MKTVRVLAPGVVAVLLRRLTRTQGVTWPRWRLYVALALVGVGAIGFATVAAYLHQPSDALTVSLYRPAVVLIISLTAGAAVMTMEGTRDRSGGTERALECLPVGRREATFLVRLPCLVLGALVVLVPMIPAYAALRSVGAAPSDAMGVVLASSGAGLVTVAVPYLAVSALLRSARWDEVRFPVILLLWGVCMGWQIAIGFAGLADHTLAGEWSWIPVVNAFMASMAGGPSGPSIVALAAAGIVAAFAVGAVFSLSRRASYHAIVRYEWRGRTFSARIIGELRYALRDPAVRANSALSLLLSGVLVTGVFLCPADLRAPLTPGALLVVGMLAASAPRTIRGTYPARIPVQRLIPMSATSWSVSTSLVVLIITAVLMAPGAALIRVGSTQAETAMLVVSTTLVSAGCAVAVGAAVPVSARNVLGQGLAGGATLGLFVVASQVFAQLSGSRDAARLLVSALFFMAAGAVAVGTENLRWHPYASIRTRGD